MIADHFGALDFGNDGGAAALLVQPIPGLADVVAAGDEGHGEVIGLHAIHGADVGQILLGQRGRGDAAA